MNKFGLDVQIVLVAPNYKRSPGRVTIVGLSGMSYEIVYDKYIQQKSKVLNYHSKVTGTTLAKLKSGKLLKNARADILDILRYSFVVGQNIFNAFNMLNITPDDLDDIACCLRETTNFTLFREIRVNKTIPSLKQLVKVFLNRDIQNGQYDSLENAHSALQLYVRFERAWEQEIDERPEISDYSDYSSSSSSD